MGLSSPNFSNINKLISKHYNSVQVEVWDDLWFWGFITQKGSGDDRVIEWNENKYWSLVHTEKKEAEIKKIKEKSIEFINLLNQTKI